MNEYAISQGFYFRENKTLEQISKFTVYKRNLYNIVINLLFGGFELRLYPGSKLDTALEE